MQPRKLEDLNAQFDSIVRRYCDGGLIAYRDARYFTKKLGNLNIDVSNSSSTKAASRKSTG